jgi:hypothetical protein
MENDALLTIYQTATLSEIEGAEDAVHLLENKTSVSLSRSKEPAVLGELAGWAQQMLLSDPAQSGIAAAEIGAILWAIIKAAKRAGKHLRVGKGLVKPLLLAIVGENEESGDTKVSVLSNSVVWGPMAAEPLGGLALQGTQDWDGATDPLAYFMAIVSPRPRNRVRTVWYLLSSGGQLCGSWVTQTYRERLPEFLRPSGNAG